jgi:hypothetical protein
VKLEKNVDAKYSVKLERKEASQLELDIFGQSVSWIQIVELIDQVERVKQSAYRSVKPN